MPENHTDTDSKLDALKEAAVDLKSAQAERTIFPKPSFTRSDETVSHYLSEADLAQLELSAKGGGMSTWASVLLGSAGGTVIPALGAVVSWISVGSLEKMQNIDMITLIIFFMSLFSGFILYWFAEGAQKTVSQICVDIKNRPKVDQA